MDPKQGGLHPDLFGPGLYGLAFMTIIEAGFVFSGNVGTGIVLARTKDGGWSPPSAVGISGMGKYEQRTDVQDESLRNLTLIS